MLSEIHYEDIIQSDFILYNDYDRADIFVLH